jgi:sodium/potassium-transporting ATPase subunit alpha
MSESDLLLPKSQDPVLSVFQNCQQHKLKLDAIYQQLSSSEDGISAEQAREVRESIGINYLSPPVRFSITFCCGLRCFGDADEAMVKYHTMVAPSCLVKRNGKWSSMDSTTLVPGDVVRIGVGDRVPADMRIIKVIAFTVHTVCLCMLFSHKMSVYLFKGRACVFDASALKGTGVKVTVDVNDNCDNYLDSTRLAFMGYRCVSGECMGIVLFTGDHTLVGQMIKNHRWPPK